MGDLGVEVKSAVGRRQAVKASLGKFREQQFPIARVYRNVTIENRLAIQRRHPGELRQGRSGYEQILRQALDRAQ